MIDLSQAKFWENFEFVNFTLRGKSILVFDAGSRDKTPPVTFYTVILLISISWES